MQTAEICFSEAVTLRDRRPPKNTDSKKTDMENRMGQKRKNKQGTKNRLEPENKQEQKNKQMQNSKQEQNAGKRNFLVRVLCILLSVVLLQVWEAFINSNGIELRTVWQIVKGTYIWLIAPSALLICLVIRQKELPAKRPAKERSGLIILLSMGILSAALCRGVFYYVLSDEFVQEKALGEGILEGHIRDGATGEEKTVYYIDLDGIFRTPFPGWTESMLTEKLQEKYGEDVAFVSREGENAMIFTAESSRTGAGRFTFQAKNFYQTEDNFLYQLMKSDAVGYWKINNGRLSFVSAEGTTYPFDSDRADTAAYPDARDELRIFLSGREAIPYAVSTITDWFGYALEDERYHQSMAADQEGGGGTSPLGIIHICMGENEQVFDFSDCIKTLETEGWEPAAQELKEMLEQFANTAEEKHSRNGGEPKDGTAEADGTTPEEGKDPAAGSLLTEEQKQKAEEEQAAKLFLEMYRGDFEKECVLGNGSLRYRMVVRDAAAGSRFYSLLKSTDGGASWEMGSSNPFHDQLGMGVDFVFLDETFGFATLVHNGGDEADLYVTEDGGLNYEVCMMQGIHVTLEDGYLYNPYDYPEMPYEEDGVVYVLCGQGLDGDYNGGDENEKALFASTDHGHTFVFQEMVSSTK